MTFYRNRFCFLRFCLLFRDSPPHVPVLELSTDKVINVIANITTTIQRLFPNLQVFPALGNHDYWPQVNLTTTSGNASRIFPISSVKVLQLTG